MVSWEDFKDKVTETGNTAVVKIRTAAQTVTVKGKIHDVEKELNENLRVLGRAVLCRDYNNISVEELQQKLAIAKDDEKDLLRAVLKVKDNESIIEEYYSEIKKLEGITACKVCGAEVTPDSDYCIKCGTRVEREEYTEKVIEDIKVVENNISENIDNEKDELSNGNEEDVFDMIAD
ncbi:MAG: zinc ribbon domain-containing protein [Lachnospiraceae bacterium]|nr:zinc ribbon domain-containing protein [Lachnospiraceae bacterium]